MGLGEGAVRHLPSCADLFSFLTSGRLLGGCQRLPAVPWTTTGTRIKSTMFKYHGIRETKLMLLAGVLASSNLVMPVGAQSPAPTGPPGATAARHYQPNRFT